MGCGELWSSQLRALGSKSPLAYACQGHGGLSVQFLQPSIANDIMEDVLVGRLSEPAQHLAKRDGGEGDKGALTVLRQLPTV